MISEGRGFWTFSVVHQGNEAYEGEADKSYSDHRFRSQEN